jgi:hypothetical protein
MFFKDTTDIITGCFILMILLALIPLSIRNAKKIGNLYEDNAEIFEVGLALMLRMNNVRQGRSRWIRSSMMESCTLSSFSFLNGRRLVRSSCSSYPGPSNTK